MKIARWFGYGLAFGLGMLAETFVFDSDFWRGFSGRASALAGWIDQGSTRQRIADERLAAAIARHMKEGQPDGDGH